MKNRILPFVLVLFTASACFGQVWEPKGAGTLPSNYNIADISIVSDQVIWAVAVDWTQATPPVPASHKPKVMKSIDGGETWEVKDIEEAMGRQSWDIHAFDENTACITTQDLNSGVGRGIFRTTDGGENWTEEFHHVAAGVWLHFFNDTEGICINANFMAKSDDGGQSWAVVPPGNIPNFIGSEFTGIYSASSSLAAFGDNLWFGTTMGRVFRSNNKGQNWSVVNTGLGNNAQITSIAFTDENHGLVSYSLAGGIRKLAGTADGGITWQYISDANNILELSAIPCTNVFMATSYFFNQTRISSDYGQTWTQKDNQVDGFTPKFKSPGVGWSANRAATGPNPALYKWAGGPLVARFYVNHAATGANDGTSWANAFNDLQDAFDIAQEGDQIWVAEGTYKPDTIGGIQNSSFVIDKNLKLYGGFVGTETNLSQRGDPADHPTILSGDLLGNDLENNPTANKLDNVLHVVRVTGVVNNETIIDGFTIKRGHADWPTMGADQSGGGIYCVGHPIIRNCSFEQNYALASGGGLYLNSVNSNGTKVEFCSFRKNRADQEFNAGGGLYAGIANSVGVTINQCEFIENVGGRGGGLASFNSNLTVTNSLFSANNNIRQGGGLWFWSDYSNLMLNVDECTFENNHSSFGGGLYANLNTNCGVNITNTTFNGNMVTPNNLGWGQGGGGVIIITGETSPSNAVVTVDNCVFVENYSSNSGGGVYMPLYGKSADVTIVDCMFEKNNCINNGSALMAAFSGSENGFELKSCQFKENIANDYEGAADIYSINSGSATVLVDSCLFDGNISGYNGGLNMNVWNGGRLDATLTNSTFTNNQAKEGGAMGFYSSSNAQDDFYLFMDKCLFDGNKGTDKAGAIAINPECDKFDAIISRATIINNESPHIGAIGAYYFQPGTLYNGANIQVINSLITNNTSNDAAVWADSTGSFNVLNSTIANNLSDGIQLANQSTLSLQNTILYNPNYIEFYAANETATFTSFGGNLIFDNSLDDLLVPTDKQGLDPLFVGNGDYHLQAGSPCVDAGVDAGVTAAFDLDGAPRIQSWRVDMGAFESPHVSSTKEKLAGEVTVSPNPTTDFLNIHLPETTTGPLQVSLFDSQGRLLQSQVLSNGQTVSLRGLAAGVYSLKAMVDEKVFVGKFIKQ